MKKVKDIFMYSLAGLVMALLFGFLVTIIFKEIPMNNKELIYLCGGIALGWGSQVIGYFFGSSKGSSDKTEIMGGGQAGTGTK